MTPREFPAEVVEKVALALYFGTNPLRDKAEEPEAWGELLESTRRVWLAKAHAALSALSPAAAAVVRGEAVAVPRDGSEDAREEIASVLEAVARDGLPGPRDLDAALDAIFCTIAAQEPPR